jgi:hypothetical protein
MKLMEITIKDLKDFRVWLKKTYGPQDAFEYEHTFTEEIAIRYAQHKQKLNVHGVSGKQPDYRTIHATAKSYSKDIWGQKDDIFYKNSIKDFEAGAKWALSQVACATAKGEERKE